MASHPEGGKLQSELEVRLELVNIKKKFRSSQSDYRGGGFKKLLNELIGLINNSLKAQSSHCNGEDTVIVLVIWRKPNGGGLSHQQRKITE